jgi:hypothetical protein
MCFRKIIPVLVLIYACLQFNSCDNSVDPSAGTVSGKLYGYNHTAIENLKVTIQNRTAYTSADGSFTLNGISYPYDVIITDSARREATVYKNISVNNIEMYFDQYSGSIYSAAINVQILGESLPSDKKWKVIFTDREFINEYTEVTGINPTAGLLINMDKNIVSGRLIALSYKKDNNGNVTSYENFGSFPLYNIQSGNTYNYWFDSLSLAFNPGEQTVTASINIAAVPFSTEFYLSFGTKNRPDNYGYTFSYLTGNNFNFKIPTGLTLPFSTVILNNTTLSSGYSYQEYNIFPNSNNDLTVNVPPIPFSPDDGAKDVNNNTQFSFNAGTGNGVYEIILINKSRYSEYRIITSENNFTLEGLDKLGFGNINNNIFDWRVTKKGPASSVNDYVTNYYNEQNHFYSEGNSRRFLTEP